MVSRLRRMVTSSRVCAPPSCMHIGILRTFPMRRASVIGEVMSRVRPERLKEKGKKKDRGLVCVKIGMITCAATRLQLTLLLDPLC